MIKNFLNNERHQNPISGSNVTAILLKGWILLLVELHWEGSAPAAWEAGLFRSVYNELSGNQRKNIAIFKVLNGIITKLVSTKNKNCI